MSAATAPARFTTLLAVFPDPLADGPAPADAADSAPATLRRAIAFIDSHVDREISLRDIAAAVSVTPRALQYAFRRHLGTTPLAYLRRARLDAAHRDLLAADPATRTVTEIAARWGFGHHFSDLYRDAYGIPPSTTLHREP